MIFSEFVSSSNGDVYQISLSSENDGLLSEYVSQVLAHDGIVILNVELSRVQGINPTSGAVLAKIEEVIANVFLSHPNVMICYYCDFLSQIPSMRQDLTVQEYRSVLFSHMFDRYVTSHHIEHVSQAIATIEGSVENYYVHIIARNEHLHYVNLIIEHVQRDYGK